ncbi:MULTISPECIES: GMC family oxidoreductase [Acidiphilium]|uniref:Choline dehydrogenase n=1 Tax=Acidiphilium rubrum TaxID=526 RepID=A0A8G2CK51_ACIRU|nr:MULTISPECIES: GMC family oxidoreductase [Acidiphilium]SIQ68783.1 Choline dehydrogenase [Acidiphilium rubrum]
MNLDTMRRHATGDTVDAVIIGTGAGGAPLLAALATAGLKVVALEAGRNWEPETFPADEIAAAGIYWRDERLSAGDTPQPFGANNSGTGVGGSTLHWGAFCPRADPRDWRLRTETGQGQDWPLDPASFTPYYEQAEAYIGVSGPRAYPWDPSRSYRLPPVARNAPAMLMQHACDSLGITTTDAPAAVVSHRFEQHNALPRPACINCGYCHQGCRIGAKASMDVTYLPAAVHAGAEIRPDCRVHTIERDATGKITAVVYRHQGHDHRQRCAAVFLCAGAVETPRLLLHLGLANSSGQVGRNYMAHVATQAWGSFTAQTRPHKGYPSSLITEDMLRPADADFAGGYLIQSLGIVPVTWAEQVARGRGLWGQPLIDYLDHYNHVAGVGINGECLPSAGNFLDLSDETDDIGMRRPRIHFSYGENEHRLERHAQRVLTNIWQHAGATDIWTMRRSAHTIGTCRMGSSADTGVVDHAGNSFDIPNLWICDNSVFPSAMAANPALTIMALSLRTADAFLRGHRT